MNFEKIKEKVLKFREERDWEQFHNPKDLATALAIEAAELQEVFLWKTPDSSYNIAKDNQEVAEEVADIFNYLILFCETTGIDLEKALLEKLEKNSIKYPVEKAKWKSDKYNKLG